MRTKRAIYNILTNLMLQTVIIAYGLIVPKILINNFGSDVNGLVTSITQLLSYITLLESGFGPVILSLLYKPIAQNNIEKIKKILKASDSFFKKISLIFVIYIFILTIIYPLIDTGLSTLSTISLIIIIAISTLAEYFFGITYRLYIQAKQKQYVISIIQIATYVLSTLVILGLAKTGATIHVIKLASGIIFTIKPLLQNLYVKKKFKISLKGVDNKYKVEKKWDGLAQHIAFVIHTNTDITVLTFMATMAEVSVYSVYYLVVCGVRKLILSFANGIEAIFGDMLAKDETKNLQNKFGIYETLYNLISTIAFSCTIVLITPFIENYTRGITDANYIRITFGILLSISEYIWTIRQPFNVLIKSAGHFKETRRGAWIEAISNIVISIILVYKFGIIGVAIGTIIAMTIRTTEFIYYANKKILRRPVWESVKKIILIVVCTIAIVVICNFLPYVSNISYINWGVNAIMVLCVSSIVTIGLNLIFLRDDFKQIKTISKRMLLKRRRNT